MMVSKLILSVAGILIYSTVFGGQTGIFREANMVEGINLYVNEGRLASPSNMESIVADREIPVTELSSEEVNRLRMELRYRDFAPLPGDPDARAMRIGETVISQDIDRVVTEVRGYSE